MMKAYSAKDLWAYEDMLYTLQGALNTARVYEVFTKDEVIAMLTDIQSEFKEGLRCKGCCNNCVNACEDIPAGWFLDFIDAKINSLKENTDGMEWQEKAL